MFTHLHSLSFTVMRLLVLLVAVLHTCAAQQDVVTRKLFNQTLAPNECLKVKVSGDATQAGYYIRHRCAYRSDLTLQELLCPRAGPV